jgi:hypothetical protein
MQVVIDIVEKGIGETPEVHGTVTYNNTLATIKGAEILRANREFLAKEATAWISLTYSATVTSADSTTDEFTTSTNHKFSVGDAVVFTGTTFGGVTAGTTYYVRTVPSTTSFTLKDSTDVLVPLTTASGTTTVTYDYDTALCQRDMRSYVDAIVLDLMKVGNYRSLQAARLYKNAVGGSQAEDMFLVANASGLRNCTLSGLYGTLTVLS